MNRSIRSVMAALAAVALGAAAALAGAGDYKELGEGGWTNTTAAAACGGKLFLVDAGKVYRVDPATGASEAIGDSGWKTRFATAVGDAVILFEEGGAIYRVDPQSGKHEKLSGGEDWSKVQSAAAIGDALYAVDAGKIYRIEAKTGKWSPVGASGWETIALVGGPGDALFSFEKGGALYRVDAKTGVHEKFEGDWSRVQGAASIGDALYAVEGGKVHRISPRDGKWEEMPGESGWATKLLVACGGKLYSVERGGQLYSIDVK